ncbi:hypothetical protein WDW86_03825 [Bdellovibrionota bacterium FG-2]
MKKSYFGWIAGLLLMGAVVSYASESQSPETLPKEPPKPTKVSCHFYANGDKADFEWAVNSAMEARNGKGTQTLKNFSFVLYFTKYEGGSIGLSVSRDDKMIQRVLWQEGDGLMLAGRSTGLVYLLDSPTSAGGAELQYSCESQ